MLPEPEMRMSMRYSGVAVDDGSMPVSQVATALQGFASAYGKLAMEGTPAAQHQLRVVAIKPGSFEILLGAWVVLGQNSGQIEGLGVIADWARSIFGSIVEVMKGKLHLKGQEPQSITVNGSNNRVVVQNFEGARIELSRGDYELLEKGELDADLAQIVSPLSKGSVEDVLLEAKNDEWESHCVVTASERSFFSNKNLEITLTEMVQVDGHFVSLNKDTKTGSFRLEDGRSVRFSFVGDDEGLYTSFVHRGKVRVQASAKINAATLLLSRLEISHVEPLQMDLRFGVAAP